MRLPSALKMMWFTRAAATMSFQMVGVAVGWQIYELTKSPFDLGLAGLMQFFPLVLFLFAVGHVVDRYDRRIVACASELIGAGAAAVLLFAAATHVVSVGVILAAVFLVGTSRAFELPAIQSLVPALVPSADLAEATANLQIAQKSAVVVGPALGGLLYALGPTVVYSLAAGLYLCSAILVAMLRLQRPPRAAQRASLSSMFAGIDFIRRSPVILGSIALDLFAVLLGGATALLPVFARDILRVGPLGLGLLRTGPAIGALVTSFYLTRRPIKHRAGPTMYAAVIVFGISTIVFGLSHSFAVSFLALVALGAGDVVSVVIRLTLVQVRTPDAMRGRVNAVNSLFTGTSNQLGEFESGLTASWFGTVPAVVLGGIGTLAVVALWLLLFPGIGRIDTLEGEPEPRLAPVPLAQGK